MMTAKFLYQQKGGYMKKTKISLILTIVFCIFIMAWQSNAGVLCLDAQGSCNDLKLFVSDRTGEIAKINGYEYGCGDPSRGLTGTKLWSGTHRYFNLTGTYNDASQVASISIDYNTASGVYSGSYSYISDSYLSGSTTYVQVPCPSAASEAKELEAFNGDEPDLTK